MKCIGLVFGGRTPRSVAMVATAVAAATPLLCAAGSARAADTLLYSFETLYNNSSPPVPDPLGSPDAFQPNDGGIITQDTFGATEATHSLKYVQNDTDTFTGLVTTLGAPFTIINDPVTTAVTVDLTIKAGEEFAGGFASLGITEFGTYQDPDLGTLTGQAQTVAASEQSIKLAAGTYRFVIPLVARSNPVNGRAFTPFTAVFHSDPFGTMTPTSFQFYINKGPTTGGDPLPNAAYTTYFDNVRAITNTVASWKSGANGNWSDGVNWYGLPNSPNTSPNVPNNAPVGIDAIAQFGIGQINGPITVTVSAPVTTGTLYFDSGNPYTIAGTSALTLDVSAGQAGINVYAGSHVISAPVNLNDDAIVNVMGSGTLTVSAATFGGAGKAVTKNGNGPATFQNIRAGALTVNAGTLAMSAKATPNDPAGTSVATALTVATGAVLDLTNNSMVIDYTGPVGTQVTNLRQALQAGRLLSSSADANRKIGFGDNAVLNKSSFAGQTVDTSSILIKFTYAGDANLDGQVDVTDLGSLATNWQTSNVWTGGDFNYDGFVDVTDLGALATNWQQGVGSPLGRGSLEAALSAVGLGGVSVPEPATVGLSILCLAAIRLSSPKSAASRRRTRLCNNHFDESHRSETIQSWLTSLT